MFEEQHRKIIKIEIKDFWGRKKSYDFESDVKGINKPMKFLRKIDLAPLQYAKDFTWIDLCWSRLRTIDLSAFSKTGSLEYLIIHSNLIREIDLTPLSSCINLKKIDINSNNLKTIDLSPLTNCHDLEIVNLCNNKLTTIDLEPLRNKTKLKILKLEDNKLKSIDLSPLSTCYNLEELHLRGNAYKEIDLTPIESLPKLKILNVNKDIRKPAKLTDQTIERIPEQPIFTEEEKKEMRENKRENWRMIPVFIFSVIMPLFGFIFWAYYKARRNKIMTQYSLIGGISLTLSYLLFGLCVYTWNYVGIDDLSGKMFYISSGLLVLAAIGYMFTRIFTKHKKELDDS